MTHPVTLLFAGPDTFLGEFTTDTHGAYVGMTLTEMGEKQLAQAVVEWRTAPVFERAATEWCAEHRITPFRLPSHVHVSCWHTILDLPFSSADRFDMLVGVAHADPDTLVAWQQFLARAAEQMATAREKALAAIAELRKKKSKKA